MTAEEEQDFIKYWEENRDAYSTFLSKLVRGLPMALVFCTPILLLIVCVYFFFPDWYMKISATSGETFIVVIIAIAIATVFYAFVRMHFKWEMNEQLFVEIKYKQKKAGAADAV